MFFFFLWQITAVYPQATANNSIACKTGVAMTVTTEKGTLFPSLSK
jgi:hypothetical protein